MLYPRGTLCLFHRFFGYDLPTEDESLVVYTYHEQQSKELCTSRGVALGSSRGYSAYSCSATLVDKRGQEVN